MNDGVMLALPRSDVPTSMQTLASVLDQAYRWLCRQRRKYGPNADVWDFRFHWPRERPLLEAELLSGRFRFAR